jgi:hypothetical protein
VLLIATVQKQGRRILSISAVLSLRKAKKKGEEIYPLNLSPVRFQ